MTHSFPTRSSSELLRSARNDEVRRLTDAKGIIADLIRGPHERKRNLVRLLIQERAHLTRPRRVLQLAQRLRLDLADAAARHAELLADLHQRMFGVHAAAQSHAANRLSARRARWDERRGGKEWVRTGDYRGWR